MAADTVDDINDDLPRHEDKEASSGVKNYHEMGLPIPDDEDYSRR